MAEGGERRFTRTNRGSRMAVLIGEAQEVADGGALPWRVRRACSRFLWKFRPCALCARVAQRRGQPGGRRCDFARRCYLSAPHARTRHR